jgi:hypothetical protein
MQKPKLVICAAFANAARGLPEWLAYHHAVGVGHFVLYDTGSDDNPAAAIRASRLAERVTLIRWPQRHAATPDSATAAHQHFIDIFAGAFDWTAFLAVDEFLLPLGGPSAADMLDLYGDGAAVLVHRRIFGPGATQAPPAGPTLAAYDRRAADEFPAHRLVRLIARGTALREATQDPPWFRVEGPVFNTAGQVADTAPVQPRGCFQHLVVNHYCLRPRQEWLAAVQQDAVLAGAPLPENEAELYDFLAELGAVRDDAIQAFLPAMQAWLEPATRPPVAAAADAEPTAGPLAAAPAATLLSAQVSAQPAPPGAAPPGAMPAGMSAPGSTPVAAATPGTAPSATPGTAATPDPAPSAAAGTAPAPATADASRPTATWLPRGQDALERNGGGALVFRDRSRAGEHWLAALRGGRVGVIDPAFLIDEFDRIKDFPSDAEARAACEAALAQDMRR